MGQGEALVGGLRQLLAVLHLEQLKVLALLLTHVLLLSGVEGSALHTVPEEERTGRSAAPPESEVERCSANKEVEPRVHTIRSRYQE